MSDSQNALPPRLLKLADVIARVSLGKTKIYAMLAERSFPAPIRLSETCVRWPEHAISQWILDREKESNELLAA